MKNYWWLIFLISGSCNTAKNHADSTLITLSITCQTHEPYCGGAYPGPGQENGFTFPMQNRTFCVKQGSSNDSLSPILQTLKTNDEGILQVKLKPGTYSLIDPDKALSFSEFLTKHQRGKQSDFFHDQDNACFARWYHSADFTFEVNPNQNLEAVFTRYTNCFSGHNPCSHYDGPLPP
jgi:hypothetical protein